LLLCFLLFGLLCLALSAKKDKKALADYVRTPGGLVHKTCVHHVGHGAEVTHNEDGTISVSRPDGIRHHILPCAHPRLPAVDGDGWQVFAVYDAGNTLASYNGTWNVPSAPPSYANQLLYTFTGLQNSFGLVSGVDIIQPVLQYGPGPAGGGAYWGVASWYVTSTNVALHSTLVEVDAGDAIFGTMVKPDPSGMKWIIQAYDTKAKTNSTLIVNKQLGKIEPYAFVTLEVYDVTDCTQYPTDPLAYTGLAIELCDTSCKAATPAWTTQSQQVICKEACTVGDDSSVTITF